MFRSGLLASIVDQVSRGDTTPVGRIAGIPVFLHPSTTLLWGVVAFALMRGIGPALLPGHGAFALGVVCGLWAILLMSSILVHELGHALVARHERVPVLGVHLFLLGGVTLLAREPGEARSELRIALAGPVVSLAAAIVACAGCLAASELTADPIPTSVLGLLAITHLLLATTNALPALPLDGGKALRALFWLVNGSRARSTVLAARAGRWLAFSLVACGLASVVRGEWLGLGIALFGWFTGESSARATTHAMHELARAYASSPVVGSGVAAARGTDRARHESMPSRTNRAIPGQLPSKPKAPPAAEESRAGSVASSEFSRR